MQTALYSATTGRNGGANIQMITRTGTNQFHGTVSHFLQNETFNANEFFLNRSGTARPQFRRNETYLGLGGPIRKNKTFFYAAVQRTDFLSGYATRAIVTTASPDGLGDVRTRDDRAGCQPVASVRRAGQSAIRREFPDRDSAASPPTRSPAWKTNSSPAPPTPLSRSFASLPRPTSIRGHQHSQRQTRRQISAAFGDIRRNRLLPGNATFGREREQVNAFPTFFNSWSGSLSLEHNFSSSDRLRLNYIKSQQYVEEAFPWANSSVSPTLGLTPGYVTSLSHIHTFGPHWTNELRGGFFELFNTRISKFRDIFNSTLGINNPLEAGGRRPRVAHADCRYRDPEIRRRNRQRVGLLRPPAQCLRHRPGHLVRGAHSLQFGGEVRRTNLKGEYMARTNGDLDYDNWILFFTGHGASGGGSDLDQGDTRRDYNMFDVGLFAQDEWRVRKG